ncbi:MAG: hypothetical protein HYY03_02755 [Chloroflexi bacterium]|nr:hypothetical protein [Chloroflexota bacterium]
MPDEVGETREFILSQVSGSIGKQMDWVDAVDRKAVALLTVASALLAVLGGIASALAQSAPDWRLAFLAFPGLVYASAMFFVWDAFRPRTWGIVPDPPGLQDWATASMEEVKRKFLDSISEAYRQNNEQILGKSRSLGRAAALIPLETVAIVLSLVAVAL